MAEPDHAIHQRINAMTAPELREYTKNVYRQILPYAGGNNPHNPVMNLANAPQNAQVFHQAVAPDWNDFVADVNGIDNQNNVGTLRNLARQALDIWQGVQEIFVQATSAAGLPTHSHFLLDSSHPAWRPKKGLPQIL